LVQGTALQHSEDTVQIWPYSAHPPLGGTTPLLLPLVPPLVLPLVLPLPLLLPLELPLLPELPPHGPHIPRELPGGRMHEVPGQQSALFVHRPHAAMHVLPEHTKGGIPPGTGLGTQGMLLQQLALDAHAAPAPTQAPEQRGTPTLS
jgi:hypothetical protein